MKKKTRTLTTNELVAREYAMNRVCDALHVLYLDGRLDESQRGIVRKLLQKDQTAKELHRILYDIHLFTWGGYNEHELEDYLEKESFSLPVAFLKYLKFDGVRKNLQTGFFVDWLNKVAWDQLRIQ